jgi:hypothetical protein
MWLITDQIKSKQCHFDVPRFSTSLMLLLIQFMSHWDGQSYTKDHGQSFFICKHSNRQVMSFPICWHMRLKYTIAPVVLKGTKSSLQLIPNCDWEKGLSYMGMPYSRIWFGLISEWSIWLPKHNIWSLTSKYSWPVLGDVHTVPHLVADHYLFYWLIWIQKWCHFTYFVSKIQ